MTNVEALKALYVALGGDADNVANANTIVDVLNAIAAKYDGDDDATLNPVAIANITAVLNNIIPDPTLIEKTITENGEYDPADDDVDGYSSVSVDVEPNLTTKSITANGTYAASADNADGYSSVTVNVPAPTLTWFQPFTQGDEGTVWIGYENSEPTHILGVPSRTPPAYLTVLTSITFVVKP